MTGKLFSIIRIPRGGRFSWSRSTARGRRCGMPVQFEPEGRKSSEAPFFEDISGDVGYRGYSTQKSIEKLQSEVTNAISNLGGYIINVQRGKFIDERGRSRFGFVFVFTIAGPGERSTVMAEIKVAAFPMRKWSAKQEDQSKKMALY